MKIALIVIGVSFLISIASFLLGKRLYFKYQTADTEQAAKRARTYYNLCAVIIRVAFIAVCLAGLYILHNLVKGGITV